MRKIGVGGLLAVALALTLAGCASSASDVDPGQVSCSSWASYSQGDQQTIAAGIVSRERSGGYLSKPATGTDLASALSSYCAAGPGGNVAHASTLVLTAYQYNTGGYSLRTIGHAMQQSVENFNSNG
jgi:hypothetical protein